MSSKQTSQSCIDQFGKVSDVIELPCCGGTSLQSMNECEPPDEDCLLLRLLFCNFTFNSHVKEVGKNLCNLAVLCVFVQQSSQTSTLGKTKKENAKYTNLYLMKRAAV